MIASKPTKIGAIIAFVSFGYSGICSHMQWGSTTHFNIFLIGLGIAALFLAIGYREDSKREE